MRWTATLLSAMLLGSLLTAPPVLAAPAPMTAPTAKPAAARPAPVVKTAVARVTASPATRSGACPTTVGFSAVVAAKGKGTVRYRWVRGDGIGVGSAGPLDPRRGTVSPVNIPAWREFPLVDTLGEVLPGRPVRLAGDAQCMALGEWWRGLAEDGAARSRAMLGMVVSTGVGGGFVLDGVPYVGPTGNAGHIGHITVDPGGEPCPCGGVGCVHVEVQEHRAAMRGQGGPEGHLDVLPDGVRARPGEGELGDGLEQRRMVHLLQGAGAPA